MNHQTSSASATSGPNPGASQPGSESTSPTTSTTATTTFTQTAADLMRELHQLQTVVQSASVLDFEAELNAALGKDAASPTSTNGHASASARAAASSGHSHNDDDGYEVVDDDGDVALASLNSDLETASRLLGLLDGKCDAMNARLDELLALMEEANDLGLDLDEAHAPVTVTVSGGESAAASGDEVQAQEQERATPPSD